MKESRIIAFIVDKEDKCPKLHLSPENTVNHGDGGQGSLNGSPVTDRRDDLVKSDGEWVVVKHRKQRC